LVTSYAHEKKWGAACNVAWKYLTGVKFSHLCGIVSQKIKKSFGHH